MKKRILALALSMAVMVSLFAGCGTKSDGDSASGDTIKIGTIQPISGKLSLYGTQTRDAIQMAVDEINEKGGVLGKKLVLVVKDDEANPEKTLNAFTKLASSDNIVGLVGALTSNCTLAITKQAQQRKIVMITPSSTNDTVTDAGDYIFRACYNDSFQGTVVAKFAQTDLKAKTAAILYDVTNDYSKGLMENFKKTFTENGGTVVSEESYSSGDKDFKAQLTNIKGKNPDVLFLPDYYSTISLIAPQVKSAGITVPMLGADGWDEATSTSDDSVIGSYYSNHYATDANDKEVKDFVDKFKAKYDATPNALAALGYDAAYILANAIEKAGSTDSEKIKDAMMQTDGKFVTGNIKFNEKRNPVKSAVMVKIEKGDDGKLKGSYVSTVNP